MPRRSLVRLTTKVANAATSTGNSYVWDSQQSGLGLRVRASGRKTWVFRWRAGRKQHISTLGVYRDNDSSEVIMPVVQARLVAREWRSEVDQGRDPRVEFLRQGDTLADLWPRFLDHKRNRENLSERTLHGYAAHYTTHLTHSKLGIASLPLRSIARRDIVQLQHAIADQGRHRAEARYQTAVDQDKPAEALEKLERRLPTAGNGAANSVMLTLSSFFSWLVAIGELERSPCEKIPKLPTAGRDPASVMDREDALEALQLIRRHARHARHDGLRDILLLLILTTQRLSDIRLRAWEDVVLSDPDVPLPYLRIEHHKSRRRTKTAKLVPLGPEALAILLARWPGSPLRARREEKLWIIESVDGRRWPMRPSAAWATELPPATGPVFPGADPRKPLVKVWHPWREIAAHATRKRVRMSDVHGLRHAGASLMLAAGVPKEHIQRVLHHSSQETTRRDLHETYDVYERIGDLLGAGLGLD